MILLLYYQVLFVDYRFRNNLAHHHLHHLQMLACGDYGLFGLKILLL